MRLSAAALNDHAEHAFSRFLEQGDGDALDEAIAAIDRAVDITATDEPDWPMYANNLSLMLRHRFRQRGRLADLDRSVAVGRAAVEAAPQDSPHRPMCLSTLCVAARVRFEQLGDPADLERAVDAGRESVELTPPGEPNLSGRVRNLAKALVTRAEAGEVASDLDEAINTYRMAISVGEGFRDRFESLSSLARAWMLRFTWVHDPQDVDRAVRALRSLAGSLAPHDPRQADLAYRLGEALWVLFHLNEEPSDLDAAIAAYQEAVDGTPVDGFPYWPRVIRLGRALVDRSAEVDGTEDLDRAVALLRQAATATQLATEERALALQLRGIALKARADRGGSQDDLDAAIQALHEAVELIPPDDPDHVPVVISLAEAYLRRSERVSGGDAARAVELLRVTEDQALTEQQRSRVSALLAAAIIAAGAGTTELDEAVARARSAVTAARPDSEFLLEALDTLAGTLGARYAVTGDERDLDEAVTCLRRALDGTPADGAAMVYALNNLMNALLQRGNRHASPSDIDEAIALGRRALTSPYASSLGPLVPVSMAGALRLRYEQSQDGSDIDEAVDLARTAVAAAGANHPRASSFHDALAGVLRARFRAREDVADLDDAVAHSRLSASTAPDGSAVQALRFSDLVVVLRDCYRLHGRHADLDEAVAAGRRAIDILGNDRQPSADVLLNLGGALYERYQASSHGADLIAAIHAFRDAASAVTSSPDVRLRAARQWADAALADNLFEVALDGFTVAIDLLGRVAWQGLDRATKEHNLRRWGGLGPDAAACAVRVGQLATAVELLERGRSVLWRQALQLRGDLSMLAEQTPELAAQLRQVRASLAEGPADAGLEEERSARERDDRRRSLARKWDDLVGQARTMPGFEHFLGPTPYRQLAQRARAGPIVVLNASAYGCFALVVTAEAKEPRVVLLSITDEDLRDQANRLVELAGRAAQARLLTAEETRGIRRDLARPHPAQDVLDWLWHHVSVPVLSALGWATDASEEPPHRIWWCPTGGFLPLPVHAATPRGAGRGAPDLLVSSYTPTISALPVPASGRRRRLRRPRQLTVAVGTAPRQPPLPFVEREVEVTQRHFPRAEGNLTLSEAAALKAAVMDALRRHSWVHFACHGLHHPASPALNAFMLWDGPLTVADLGSVQPPDPPELAFLSACETASVAGLLPEESIHLASAMQLVGYRHVVGTLWAIRDAPAPTVADLVYDALRTRGGSSRMDPDRSAYAVREAVLQLRAQYPDQPLIWAPYVHLGP